MGDAKWLSNAALREYGEQGSPQVCPASLLA